MQTSCNCILIKFACYFNYIFISLCSLKKKYIFQNVISYLFYGKDIYLIYYCRVGAFDYLILSINN